MSSSSQGTAIICETKCISFSFLIIIFGMNPIGMIRTFL